MIMPRGSDQLLLPVNPLFIGLTLLLALGVNLLPLGRHPAQPFRGWVIKVDSGPDRVAGAAAPAARP